MDRMGRTYLSIKHYISTSETVQKSFRHMVALVSSVTNIDGHDACANYVHHNI